MFKKINLLFLLVLSACGGAGGVGTDTGNPSVPTAGLKIVPDFSVYLEESAITESTSISSEALTRDETPILWEPIFILGGVAQTRNFRNDMETLGTQIETAISEAGITEITTTPQTLTLADPVPFSNNTSLFWTVEILLEPTDTNYVRIYFTNTDTGALEGTYLFSLDANNDANVGLIAVVNPNCFSSSATSGRRLMTMAFDFSDTTKNLLIARADQYFEGSAGFVSYHTHYQCNNTSGECIAEYLEIDSDEPTRTFGDIQRISWIQHEQPVCVATVDYSTGSAVVSTPQAFDGPAAAGETNTITGTCTLATPYWGSHVYTISDLPVRYLDVTPNAGTAVDLYIDGVSKTGWDSLTPALIPEWLLGNF